MHCHFGNLSQTIDSINSKRSHFQDIFMAYQLNNLTKRIKMMAIIMIIIGVVSFVLIYKSIEFFNNI
jgi:hypothetical protein